MEERITRVMHMEALYDKINAVFEANVDVEKKLAKLKSEIEELDAYYTSPLWLEDFDADARGELPKDLKRGILTEDALSDLFCDLDQVLKK